MHATLRDDLCQFQVADSLSTGPKPRMYAVVRVVTDSTGCGNGIGTGIIIKQEHRENKNNNWGWRKNEYWAKETLRSILWILLLFLACCTTRVLLEAEPERQSTPILSTYLIHPQR